MKTFKKFAALLLAAIMVIGMAIPTMAASAGDDVEIKITGLKKGDVVTLYDITDETYSGTNFQGSALKTKFANTDPKLNLSNPSAEAINAVAKLVGDSEKVAASVKTMGADGDYSYKINAGAYIAIITPAVEVKEGDTVVTPVNNRIYNPVYLASYYDANGNLAKKNDVAVTSNYAVATVATAKSSEPTVDKTITNQPTDEDLQHNAIIAQSLGTLVNYEVAPTMPSYPSNATNKTWYFEDTMDKGLTYVPDSLKIKFEDATATPKAQEVSGTLANGVYTFTYGGKTIATAKAFKNTDGTNGYRLSFVYDNVRTFTEIKLAYSSVINENAIIGDPGNWNRIDMFYSNKPNENSTYDDLDEAPQEGNGIVKKEDEYVVYTYRVAFKKVGEGDDANALEGAVFGIYSNQACTDEYLIETVTTNESGYAVSSQVGPGDYWVKEIKAPGNYKLNETPYKITAEWATAEYRASSEITTFTYTSKKAEAKDRVKVNDSVADDSKNEADWNAKQVGWLKDNVFYAKSVFTGTEEGVVPAYLKTETTTATSSFTKVENPAATDNNCPGIVLLGSDITNTKTPQLPSTGGMGTYIFTALGIAIMAIAASLLVFKRRRA